jgi:hypothetical protein
MEVHTYTYLWEFEVSRASESAFRQHYGPTGTWARLFRHSPAYIETLLLEDHAVSCRYLTIDRWQSEEAYLAFRSAFASQYEQLDNECEHLTLSERCLGAYHEFVA